jgi:hypothetical protein
MKKFLLRLLFFSFFTVIIYILLILIAASIAPSYAKNIAYYAEKHMVYRMAEVGVKKNLDVLILGSSHAYRGYDVRLLKSLGTNIFNFGSSSQTPVQTEFLFNKYRERLNPKFVIIDIYPVLFNSDGIESTTNIVSNAKFDKDILKLILKMNNIKVYNTAIVSIFKQLLHNKDIVAKQESLGKGAKYILGGYVETRKTSALKTRYSPSTYKLSSENLKSLKNIITTLKNDKIPYILVQAPTYGIRYSSVTNTKEIDSTFSILGRYYNFNKILQLPSNAFMDDSHMNQIGVNIFNRKLLDIIKSQDLMHTIKVNQANNN